jgi:hypothetical protein
MTTTDNRMTTMRLTMGVLLTNRFSGQRL